MRDKLIFLLCLVMSGFAESQISLTPATASIALKPYAYVDTGSTQAFKCTTSSSTACSSPVYSSSDPAVAVMSGSTAIAMKAGTTTITVTANGTSSTATLKVNVALLPERGYVTTGGTITPECYVSLKQKCASPTYSSSDPAVASVSGGTVTALRAGSSTISVATPDGFSNSIMVTVRPPGVYTATATHLTMHAGDPVPPLIFKLSTYQGSYSSLFKGQPTLTTTATSTSAVGTYPIAISAKSMGVLNPKDSLDLVAGSIDVIPADGIGAKLTNRVIYPPGFVNSGPLHPMLDVTSNSTATMVANSLDPAVVEANTAALSLLTTQNGFRTSAGGGQYGNSPLYLYFPPGRYAICGQMTIFGNTWDLVGAGAQTSVLYLAPNCPAFGMGTATQFFDNPTAMNKNSNFREYIENMGIEIGVGNPDAIPLTTEANNLGAFRNVQIWADDSSCPYGISFRRAYPGPLLLKNVAIYGCQSGISSNQAEYSITAEGITFEGQTAAALDLNAIHMNMRHILSDNKVKFAVLSGSRSSLALLDSKILNGDESTPGITVNNSDGIYVKRLASSGYKPTVADGGAGSPVVTSGNVVQYWTGEALSAADAGRAPESLHLPDNETPLAKDADPSSWTRLSATTSNWPSQIAGSSSATVYAPPGSYTYATAIEATVPDNVNHIQFFHAYSGAGKNSLTLNVAGNSSTPLLIDGCPYNRCIVHHTGSRTVVVTDTFFQYISAPGAGDVYLENVMPFQDNVLPVFYSSQHIWARQLNLESPTGSKFTCKGCTMWVLGYKTEHNSPRITLTDHARAEFFGSFHYQQGVPSAGDSQMFVNDSSAFFASTFSFVVNPAWGSPNWVSETRSGVTKTVPTSNTTTSQILNAFYSFGSGGGEEAKGSGKSK